MEQNNKHLWEQFCRLGEMIGDGLHYEVDGKWISSEYRKLSRILIPEIKEQEAERRKIKSDDITKKMEAFLVGKQCKCGGKLIQKRKGTLVCYCDKCNARYKARYKNTKQIVY